MPRKFMVIGAGEERRGIAWHMIEEIREKMGQLDSIITARKDQLDVTRERDMREWIFEERPTHVVYCAGINVLDWIGAVKHHDFERIMEVNVWGFVSLMKYMAQAGIINASLVAISSDAASRPMRTSIAYCASKAALDMAVRVGARERAAEGWRVNAVSPGKVQDTAMTDYVDQRVQDLRGWTKEQAEQIEQASSPLGRSVYGVEVSEVVWSVLNGPVSMTGQIVQVNGGR
jgi:NAD(P)-dependent dehydrogenase (short-subunit alcohol dehydrogenase family)